MRVGFTIIYNGLHHLEHNDYGEYLPRILDKWIIVEGAAEPGGSTNWCNSLNKGHSDDGTLNYIKRLALEYDNVFFVFNLKGKGEWVSKDEMVNAALSVLLAQGETDCFLWQIDADEQWSGPDMDKAENALADFGGSCGCFHAEYFVGKGIVAQGCWGEGSDPADPLRNAYRRLWRWKGQKFQTHEPPLLVGGNGREVLLDQRFKHYAYYFEKDVIFKSKYYKDYADVHHKWMDLQKEEVFPQPINRLIGGYWGGTDTWIVRYKEKRS